MRPLRILLILCAAACGPTATPAPAGPAEPTSAATDPAGPADAPLIAAAAAGEPTPAATHLDGSRLLVDAPFLFQTGTATLDVPGSMAALTAVRGFLADKPDVTTLRIEGHSDGAGQDEGMASGERAFAIGRWLVEQGVDCERLLIAGFGGTKPISSNQTAEGRAQNRRIELHVAALRGLAIGGMPTDGGAPAAVDACP